jgi:hypothetical protein
MAATVLLAAAILAQQTSIPLTALDQTVDSSHSVFETDSSQPDLAVLAAEVSTGRKDTAWSSATEAALLTAYRALPLFAEGADSLRARCNATLREVTGISPSSLDGDSVAAARFITLTGNALGLDLEVAHARTTRDTPPKVVLVAYWHRRTE